MTSFTVACIQTTTVTDIDRNLDLLRPMIRQAAGAGANFITMPENATMLDRKRPAILSKAREEADHPAIPFMAEMARETEAWLLAGSLTIRLDEGQVANRSFLFDPSGAVAARYDKIHMFDVDLASGERYRESSYVRSGEEGVLASMPWGLLGMTICYDLRFTALYRALAQGGASFLTVPAAFTHFTGKAHWHVLLRARAIETGCFVIAPAQTGTHEDGRRTYGHSLIVAPWGEVLADAGEAPGVITAEIDLAKVEEARGMVPSLRHDREFKKPGPVEVAARLAGE
jgi:predicted amidohydrolase